MERYPDLTGPLAERLALELDLDRVRRAQGDDLPAAICRFDAIERRVEKMSEADPDDEFVNGDHGLLDEVYVVRDELDERVREREARRRGPRRVRYRSEGASVERGRVVTRRQREDRVLRRRGLLPRPPRRLVPRRRPGHRARRPRLRRRPGSGVRSGCDPPGVDDDPPPRPSRGCGGRRRRRAP